MTCTWKNCLRPYGFIQLDAEAKPWANLCLLHAKQMNEAVRSGDQGRILRCWTMAKGGTKEAIKGIIREPMDSFGKESSCLPKDLGASFK